MIRNYGPELIFAELDVIWQYIIYDVYNLHRQLLITAKCPEKIKVA